MKNRYVLMMVVVFAFAKANSQVVINELDADTPSTNDRQFVELKTDSPFQTLENMVLVFFNGSNSATTGNGRVYYSFDLDGLTSDVNGLLVLGSSLVSPAVDARLAEGNIQIGADAIALYSGTPDDFPDRSLIDPNNQNLIDGLVYDTDDADVPVLLEGLGQTIQYNENENGRKTTESIQRKNDGTFEVKAPTPHSLNDAIEPSFIGLDFSIAPTGDLNEGDSFDITFTLTRAATEDFNVSYSLNNQGFNTTDFTGTTDVFIPAGSTVQVIPITLIDDTEDEGDELFNLNIDDGLASGFKRLKDDVEFLVIDNDFTVANYGNPDEPTYGLVSSTAPDGYYDSLDNKASPDLESAITAIIAQTGVVRHHTYADITTILKQADASALNSNKVWLLYNEIERRDVDFQNTRDIEQEWNREHVFPRSRGNYDDLEDVDDIADGINIWVETSVDSLRHGNSDAHHLRATDVGTNSSRGNRNYPEYNGPAGNKGSWHGDVARSLFYMALRYNGLEVVNGTPEARLGQIGDLTTLLEWHLQDPPDDFEMNRNNVIYEWQRNRNPFIDRPELVDFIYGDKAGQPFTLSSDQNSIDQLVMYPNPSSGSFYIQNINQPISLEIFDATGRLALQQEITNDIRIDHNLATGIYLVRLSNDDKTTIRKLIVP